VNEQLHVETQRAGPYLLVGVLNVGTSGRMDGRSAIVDVTSEVILIRLN